MTLRKFIIGNLLIILLLHNRNYHWTLDVFNVAIFQRNADLRSCYFVLCFVLLASIMYIAVYAFNFIIPNNVKTRIASFGPFGKPWERVFDKITALKTSLRITSNSAKEIYHDVYAELEKMTDEDEKGLFQSTKWYSIYKMVENNEGVAASREEFFLSRDMFVSTITFFVLYIVLFSMIGVRDYKISSNVVVWLMAEIVVLKFVTVSKAKEFTFSVIDDDIHSRPVNSYHTTVSQEKQQRLVRITTEPEPVWEQNETYDNYRERYIAWKKKQGTV